MAKQEEPLARKDRDGASTMGGEDEFNSDAMGGKDQVQS